MAQPQQLKAIVKTVLSGDTVVLRHKAGPVNGQPTKERILHLSSISAPRLGSAQREDEPHAFAAREIARKLAVGKEVAFRVLSSVGAGEGAHEYGQVLLAPLGPGQAPRDLAHLLVGAGLARVREGASAAADDDALRALEVQAKESQLGLWAPEDVDGSARPVVSYGMGGDAAQQFLVDQRGREIDAVVEGVRDGSTLRLRLLLPPAPAPAPAAPAAPAPPAEAESSKADADADASSSTPALPPAPPAAPPVPQQQHQFVTLSLAGLKAPKTSSDPASFAAEPLAEDAKFFVESRLLQREVKCVLISSPASLGQSPLQQQPAANGNGNGASAPAFFVGLVRAPQGSIGDFLVGAGLAKVLDWHAGLLSSFGGLDKLRANEKAARDGRKGIWASFEQPSRAAPGAAANGGAGAAAAAAAPAGPSAAALLKGKTCQATVTRVWSADSVSLVETPSADAPPVLGNGERRVQLSSVRAPRATDPKIAFWANEGREFARKKLIGKTVQVTIDYVKPAEGEFEEKYCVTVKFGGAHANIAELLIEKGLCSVLRHRKDDEDRSPEMEKLITAEQAALAESRGIHDPKERALPRIIDASESGAKAAQFLPFFKRAGRQPAVVEFVAAGSRFKVTLPKEDKKLTLVLAGIRAPRTARNASEKSEPWGAESARFSSQFMQRDVEVEFESTDKTGGFVGSLYANKTTNVGVELVRAGLASVHGFSAEQLSTGKALLAAEEEAKQARRGLWSSYDPAVEEAEKAIAAASLQPAAALPTAYQDVIVSHVRTSPPFAFYVQQLNAANNQGQALEKLMSEFGNFHKTTAAKAPVGWSPKPGEVVSAQFSEDGQWYRARATRVSGIRKESEVLYIDYGNDEVLPFSRLRPIDAKFKTLPPQAQQARLSFVKLVKPESDYGAESLDRFRDLAEGRKLIANVDYKEPSLQNPLLHLRLIDPKDPRTASDPTSSVNSDLLREGLASIDTSVRYLGAYKPLVGALETATNLAKRERAGQFEFGDVSED